MRPNHLSGFAIVLLIAGSAGGCARTQPSGSNSAPLSDVAAAGDANALYDPTTLKEVKKLANLPEGVQFLANNSFMRDRFDYTPTQFLIGGVGGSSAIVAYEQGGYVPSYHAQSYVFIHSRWVPAKHWLLQSKIGTLRDLIFATAQDVERQ